MSKWLMLILITLSVSSISAQNAPPRYQSGMVTAVSPHPQSPGKADSGTLRYDVSIRVGNTVYIILYTPPDRRTMEYSVGLKVLALVKDNTLTCNALGKIQDLPIIRREALPANSGIDFSRISGEYFSMKRQHLSEALGLTNDQLAKMQPILEQETGEVGELVNNPAFSTKEKLNRWKKIVQASDKKIEPLLSQGQLEKLHAMRKEQEPKMEELIKEQKRPATKH